jgi:Fe-S cluster biogenesis protein NfuA/nitrite reductase/ring-hydroxylating ferredoxin subunit
MSIRPEPVEGRNGGPRQAQAASLEALSKGGDPLEPPRGLGALSKGGDPLEPPRGLGALSKGGDPLEPPKGLGALGKGSDPLESPKGLESLSETGERIEGLLGALATHGPVAQQRAEDLVSLVTNLYGAGLERLLQVLSDSGRLDQQALDALADDQLVAGLLLVHGLHPYNVQTRVAQALDSVRPYLGSHGGDVELLGVDAEGVVTLRMLGSCDGCPSSSVTLQLAVEDAIQAAAPEVSSIEVDTSRSESRGVIPVESLRVRLDVAAAAEWVALPELDGLAPGEIGGFNTDGVELVACRMGDDVFAYRDRCPACSKTLAGATLQRRLGGRADSLILACPHCPARYDVRGAGAALDSDLHLEPLPVLRRSGMLSVAVPIGV